MTIGERIRFARKKAGMSASDLAKAIYSKSATISNWERGKTEPRLSSIIPICRATNVTPNWLAGWDADANHSTMSEITSHLMAAMAVVDEMKKREKRERHD